MSLSTEEFWRGEFGRSYTERNRVDWERRKPFWRFIIDKTDLRSALEVGCNVGWNLRSLSSQLLTSPRPTLFGIDINEDAVEQAKEAGLSVGCMSALDLRETPMFDLVFTVGVLIHIPTSQLHEVMTKIVRTSRRYVLAVEYADEKEVEIEYRGHSGKLWCRPFGKMYEDMGLKMVETGFLDKDQGFDQCTYWLLEK